MNREHIYVPIAIVCGVLLVGSFIYATAVRTPGGAPSPSTEEVATTTTTTPVKTPSSGGATRPATSKDTMMVSIKEGTVPLSTSFTLTLNTSRSCTPPAYTLDFGDSGTKDISVPPNQCGKVYTVTEYHQYTRAGIFTAALRTKPLSGAAVTLAQATLTVKDQGITTGTTKYGTFTTSPIAGKVPLLVSFMLSVSDNVGTADTRYEIDYRDGATAQFPKTASPTLTHTFTTAGSYAVSVLRKSECSSGTCTTSIPIGTIVITTY